MSESNYKNFIIKPKRDFGQYGYLIDGKMIKEGWIVTDHQNVNVMPGATWFQTIKQSKLAIDVLIKYGENNFWNGWNKEKLNDLEKELAKEEKIVEKKEKEININPVMIKLVEERRTLGQEHNSVRIRKEKLEVEIKRQFGMTKEDMYYFPRFQHRTSEWSEDTNIDYDVLSEISRCSSLYLLRNEDIENAVRTLITKAFNECPELVELTNRYNILNNRINELRNEERDLDKKLRQDFHSEIYDIRQKISKIKQQLANPKKFIEQEKRQSKRDRAREKLKDPKILDGIYKNLKIKIPKRKTNIKVKKE